ncbi:hypothetical protein WG899_21465 [Paucibacter sp. AS339]|uniref:hypothetical protein n=1 Tax=Paucibacter hankyongi TaxID=3133434 RepID=UPI0030AA1F92
MSTPQNDDINQLVDRAQNKLREDALGSQGTAARRPLIGVSLSVLAWLAAIFLWGWQLWPQGPNDAEIGKELELLIGEARDSVERYVKVNNELPVQLPAPALSLVIGYQVIDPAVTPPRYALNGRIGHVSRSWTNAAAPGGAQ